MPADAADATPIKSLIVTDVDRLYTIDAIVEHIDVARDRTTYVLQYLGHPGTEDAEWYQEIYHGKRWEEVRQAANQALSIANQVMVTIILGTPVTLDFMSLTWDQELEVSEMENRMEDEFGEDDEESSI